MVADDELGAGEDTNGGDSKLLPESELYKPTLRRSDPNAPTIMDVAVTPAAATQATSEPLHLLTTLPLQSRPRTRLQERSTQPSVETRPRPYRAPVPPATIRADPNHVNRSLGARQGARGDDNRRVAYSARRTQ